MEQDQSKVLLVEGAGDEGVIKEILDDGTYRALVLRRAEVILRCFKH